jgi:predicted ATPase
MRLTAFRVTNFRSIEDSGEITVGPSTCLVGKNEAGKTAILSALAALNPHPSTPMTLDVERDFPRHRLTEYQKVAKHQPAVVITTTWKMDDEDERQVEAEFGPDCLTNHSIVVSRKYDATAPSLEFQVNDAAATMHLIEQAGLSELERTPLLNAGTVTELSTCLEAKNQPTEKQAALLAKIKAYPEGSLLGFVRALLKDKLPKFMYFSHYDRMEGQLRLDTYDARLRSAQPKIEPGEQVFVDFLEYSGTSVADVTKSSSYESLNARCEAASIRITQQLQRYWSQNPFLKIVVTVNRAQPADAPPFNDGIIGRARVRNDLHGMTVPFSERSAGFIWFFSFMVKFAQVTKGGHRSVILLDEPGLTLHGRAQGELLRFFEREIVPGHQLLFTTHSPFMIPADDFPSIRIVEDRVLSPRPGQWASEGTKVRSDALVTDRDTLFPLQGALGYEVTQALFVGKNTLLVEGPGDILFLQALSSAAIRAGMQGLPNNWSLCPAGGLDKVQSFVSLFSSAKLNLAVLTDFANADRKKLDSLSKSRILESDRILTFASILGVSEADIEDIFSPALYVDILNASYEIPACQSITEQSLGSADATTSRLVKKAEAIFRMMPPTVREFNHFEPAEWLFRHPELFSSSETKVTETLDRAAKVFAALAKIPMV